MTALRLPTTVGAIRAELDRDSAALSHLMDFDHPVTVHADGTVTDGPPSVYAPDLINDELDMRRKEWTLLDGYSGQDRYAGPVMHDSEFIGRGMALDILAEPGTYVAVVSRYLCTDDEHANGDPITDDDERGTFTGDDGITHTYVMHGQCEDYLEGWAVARLTED